MAAILFSIGVVLIVIDQAAGIPVYYEISKKDVSVVSSIRLPNGGQTKYGVHPSYHRIESNGHKELYISTDCTMEDYITVLLTEGDIQMRVESENINESLSTGSSINEVYSLEHFNYSVMVTGTPLGSTFYYKVIKTAIDEDNTRSVVCNQSVKIDNQSGVPITCSSISNGYYEVQYHVPDNVTGRIRGAVMYSKVDIQSYRNWSSHSCTLSNYKKSCSIPVGYKASSSYKIIVIVASSDSCELTLVSEPRDGLIYLTLVLPVLLVIICCLSPAVFALIVIKCCCREKIKKAKLPIGKQESEGKSQTGAEQNQEQPED